MAIQRTTTDPRQLVGSNPGVLNGAISTILNGPLPTNSAVGGTNSAVNTPTSTWADLNDPGVLVNPAFKGDRLSLEDQSGQAATQAFGQIRNFLGPISNAGFQNLLNIILSQGRTDPAMMNRQLSNINRTTQNTQDALAQRAAQSGIPMSGALLSALSSAGRAGGAAEDAVIAEEAARAESLKRTDQELLNAFLAMALGGAPIKLQSQQQRWQRSAQKEAAIASVVSSLAGGAGMAMGGI